MFMKTQMSNITELPVKYIKGVGPKIAKQLEKLSIETLSDLLFHFPLRYEDRRVISKVSQAAVNKEILIRAKVIHFTSQKAWRSKMHVMKAVLSDESGSIMAIWFNQSFLEHILTSGAELFFYGKVGVNNGRLQLVNPEIEPASDEGGSLNMGRIVPVYGLGPLSKSISQKKIRAVMFNALNKAREMDDFFLKKAAPFLPKNIMSRFSAFFNMHFPENFKLYELARRRFVFEEFFLFSLLLEEKKEAYRSDKNRKYIRNNALLKEFVKKIPFQLTDSQSLALKELSVDLFSKEPMHRLLQGDVGSGKTIVAFYLAAFVLGSNYKVVLMVPTEILAKQHYQKAKELFDGLCQVVLLTGSIKGKSRDDILSVLKQDGPVFAIGTHALIQPNVEIKDLGLIIIDEQHRFGVQQRISLSKKAYSPDLLVMTATPIPRSLAMTLYGDLDITTIKGLPPGRQPIETIWIDSDKKDRLYSFIREKILEGRQIYMVFPLVQESEELDLLAAEEMYKELKENIFPDIRLGLIHGKMSAKEKDQIMNEFYDKKIDLLVATVVIEVGIDVPNASVIVIEHAERFGLSQLHQLRGRIGRGSYKSYCVVVSDSDNEETKKRLGAFVKYTDGFKLSEIDLLIRGPGEFSGIRQHGPTEFRVGNPITDFKLLSTAKASAKSAYKAGIKYKHFTDLWRQLK